jgi:hypothetical protein
VAATLAPLADTSTLAQTLALLGTVTDVGDAPRGSVQAPDVATALLVSVGRRAARLRSAIGMSPVPDLLGLGRE